MKILWIIALNTYREIIRDRILYGLIVFAVLLLGLSLILGQLSFAEQARISVNFGLVGIHLSAVISSIFIGSTLVSKEIEKQTILTLLAKPISRIQFLCGKFLGLTLINLAIIGGLSSILVFIVKIQGWEYLNSNFYSALFGILLEGLLLLSVTIVFGMFTKPVLSICFSLGVYLIGHWLDDMAYFAQRSESQSFQWLSQITGIFIPNLEAFNWRSIVHTTAILPTSTIFNATLYGLSWGVLLMIFAAFLFRRRDFV